MIWKILERDLDDRLARIFKAGNRKLSYEQIGHV